MRLPFICVLSVAVLAAVGHVSAAETLDQQTSYRGSVSHLRVFGMRESCNKSNISLDHSKKAMIS
jgi:hypothetical protein